MFDTELIDNNDASSWYRARMIASSMQLWKECGMTPTRGYTIGKMLTVASSITGKCYTTDSIDDAIVDVTYWASIMQSSLRMIHANGTHIV